MTTMMFVYDAFQSKLSIATNYFFDEKTTKEYIENGHNLIVLKEKVQKPPSNIRRRKINSEDV
jgi:hypothetical protein